jgi:hypothetical protein
LSEAERRRLEDEIANKKLTVKLREEERENHNRRREQELYTK